MSGPPSMSAELAATFDRFPVGTRVQLLEVRHLIFSIAEATPVVGTLTETLKWGEPAYLTDVTGSGSTVRLGGPTSSGGGAILFNCRTTLVETFRTLFADTFAYQGNRAIHLDPDKPLPEAPLAICLGMALTYHKRRAGALAVP